MSQVLDSVAHLLVTDDNPPQDIDGMDHERCAALHNAIFKHGWIQSGRDADDFDIQTRPWLEYHNRQSDLDAFHPSVLAFLSKARVLDLNHPVHFFYNVEGINIEMGGHEYLYPDYSDSTMTLYSSYDAHTSHADGLVYDQDTHTAIMHFDITDDFEAEYPWQALECIFTVWIEMIQRQKIVALSDEIDKEHYIDLPGGGFRITPGPDRDPTTGAKRLDYQTSPWTMQPWTARDLDETLELWALLVDEIENKMGLDEIASPQHQLLLEQATLDAAGVPDGFARKFLAQAQRPRFTFIAPGLQVPTAEAFVAQPFISAWGPGTDTEKVPPILLFRNSDATVSSKERFNRGYSMRDYHPEMPSTCPVGLYLEPCGRTYRYPQEDGCRLVLPYAFAAGWAKRSDGTWDKNECDSLLQAGVNPYNDRHPVQLQAFLETAYRNLQSGEWTVDANGVAGGLEKWRDADTEAHSINYVVALGPGAYW